MRSKFSGSHASLNIVTLCSEYVCTCHDMTLYGRVTLLVHTGERIRVWYGRVSHGIFTAKVQKDLEDAADMGETIPKPRIRFDPDVDIGAASTKFLGWVRRNVAKKDIPDIEKFFETLPESKHRTEAKLSFIELDSNKKFSVADCMVQLERKRARMHY